MSERDEFATTRKTAEATVFCAMLEAVDQSTGAIGQAEKERLTRLARELLKESYETELYLFLAACKTAFEVAKQVLESGQYQKPE